MKDELASLSFGSSFILHPSSFILSSEEVAVLAFLTIAVMGIVVYAFWNEGLLTAVCTFVNVLLAGLVAFNFFEPIADALEPMFETSPLKGYEDSLVLVLVFCLVLAALRWATNTVANTDLVYHPALLRGGCVLFGLLTGYLTAGFLTCVFQTLPWHENFLGFEPGTDGKAADQAIRRVLPPDRVWLALMYRAGAFAFSNSEDEAVPDPQSLTDRYKTFDKYATFSLRYARYRRYGESGEPKKYLGEFEREVHRAQ
jgi:uncharacterized membrane protein required for colicin V production